MSTAVAQPVEPAVVLAAAREAYTAAPGITDSFIYHVTLPGAGIQEGAFRFALGANQDLFIDMSSVTGVATGDTLYVAAESSPGVYFETPILGGVYATLRSVFRESTPPPLPQALLRWGATDEEFVASLGYGLVTPDRIEAASLSQSDDGHSQYELTLGGSGGTVVARFDAASGFLVSLRVEATPEGAPPEVKIVAEAAFSPVATADAASAVSFDPAGRERIYTVSALLGSVIEVGDTVPDITLATADGSEISISDFRGKALVLEFWSSWCALCRVTLPAVEQFAAELDASAPVAVLAVNTLETRDQDWRKRADASWSTMSVDLPVCYDSSDALANALGVEGLPITIVVGPDGAVVAVLSRETKDLKQSLRDAVAAALAD